MMRIEMYYQESDMRYTLDVILRVRPSKFLWKYLRDISLKNIGDSLHTSFQQLEKEY